MVNNFDSVGFSFWLYKPDDEVGLYEQQLKHDHRKNNTSGVVQQRYNIYQESRKTETSHYLKCTVPLLNRFY
jgi:hypothetical protein